MIIKTLKLQAFGPFRELIEIDFSKFQSQDIFLISGPTGSGKSTLFDGIFYALYGKLANSEKTKESDLIKSQYADHNTECFAELSFEHLGTDYTIKRSPTQTIIGKRGRVINQLSQAYFSGGNYYLDKIIEIDNKVEQLIGLKADQFKQIVLLPQGEFQKLLLASSNDKLELFRKIFNTEVLNNFKLKLDEKSKTARENIAQLENTISAQFELLPNKFKEKIDDKSHDKLIKLLNHEVERLTTTEKESSVAYNKLTSRLTILKSYLSLNQELEENQAIWDILKDEKINIDEIKTKLKLHEISIKAENLLNNLNVSLKKYDEYQLNVKEENKNLSQINDELTIKNQEFTTIEVSYKALKQKRTELQELTATLTLFDEKKNYLSSIQDLKLNLETNQSQLEEIEKISIMVDQEIEHLNSLEEKLKNLNVDLKDLEQQLDKFQIVEQEKNKLNKSKDNLIVLQANLNSAFKKQQDYQTIYHHQIAGILALELTEGKPCPVCGSVHHPLKATIVDENVSFEAVKQAQTDYQKINDELYKIRRDISNSELLLKENILEEDLTSLDFKKSHKELKENISKIEQLLKSKPQLLEKKNNLVRNIDIYKETIATINGQIIEQTERKAGIDLKLKDQDELKVQTKVDTLSNEIENTEKKYQSIKDTLAVILSNKESTEKSIALFTNEMKSYEKLSIEQKSELEEYLIENKLDSAFRNNLLELNLVTDLKKQISDFENKLLVTESKIKDIQAKLQLINVNKIKKIDLASLEIETEQLKLKLFNISANLKQFKAISDVISEKIRELLKRKASTKDLLELANYAGGNKKTGYLSFESYILALLYDDVINFANLRLKELSQGQYYFRKVTLDEDKVDGRSRNVGLDLEVYDAHTGESRSVRSLSGGETFYASLALALGLSDVISNQLGGIQLDFLLIDEGFGSLDNHTLEQAITALRTSSKAERLVGIISHVAELRQQINSQIIVTKSPFGSKISIKI